jgi:ribosomal protein L37AE/L43A
MKKAFCPRCGSFNLELISDGFYRCKSCGYEGSLGMEKEVFKR